MKVVFSRAAQADISEIHRYIARDNPYAAKRVVAAIEEATGQLEEFPYSGRVGGVAGTRELVVRALPYIVVYRVLPDLAEVIAVFHAAQDSPRGGSKK
jgi:toxin ParE1/3/4